MEKHRMTLLLTITKPELYDPECFERTIEMFNSANEGMKVEIEKTEIVEAPEEKHQAYIEDLADGQILPWIKQFPGDKFTSSKIKEGIASVASDNSIHEALDFLEAGGAVISIGPTPEKPKRWQVPS